ncbi:response regulator [Allocoleopsis sp.]|uniref:response regulator n=1 Tax=Allocoleopsis sp. TaxID=3088169 RepID=UPI002FD0F811
MKILLVEDDEPTAWALERALNEHHYTVNLATDGQIGLELATSFDYDLILLDFLIPKLDGISLCRKLRLQGYQKPILLLTAKDSNADIVRGLDAGADDYVIKPYNNKELMARIRALLRRGNTPVTSVLTWGELRVNPVLVEVTFREQPLSLTPKEYSLLQLFLRNPQRIFSRSAIIDSLWSLDDSPTENAVTVHIKDLRQKLRASGATEEIIETVYGLGYRLKALPKPSQPTFANSTTASIKASQTHSPSKELDSVNKVLERFRPTFAQRVAGLERTTSELLSGDLSDDLRQTARQDAHKLAGSLGTFGYPEGSKLARQIEHLLMGKNTLGEEEASQFKQLVSALGQELTKPPVAPTAQLIPVAQKIIRALLIDDDIALAERLKAEAVACGVEMAIATNLTTAKQAIAQTPPDVVVLDLTFSKRSQDGLTLLRELTEQFPTLPVLVFTGRDNLAERVAVSRLGGRGFLHKPVEPKQVFRAIAQVLSPTQTAHAKVMVVDDDPVALTTLSSLLQPWGFQVTSLENPQQFWDVLTATEPNLLILDLEMPTFSGIDLCQVVRLDPQWGDLPILVVTAHTDAESLQQVFAAGADDFIGKPVVGPELVTRVISRLERVRFRQQLDDIQQKMGKRL